MSTIKARQRAEDYRNRAVQAQASADRQTLSHSREQHASAAAAWRDLADAEERRADAGQVFLGDAARSPRS